MLCGSVVDKDPSRPTWPKHVRGLFLFCLLDTARPDKQWCTLLSACFYPSQDHLALSLALFDHLAFSLTLFGTV